jgi:hypothetical protein
MHYAQRSSSHSRHQTSDGLEIWRLSHIPQKDGELDIMLISCNILLVLKQKLAFIVFGHFDLCAPLKIN